MRKKLIFKTRIKVLKLFVVLAVCFENVKKVIV